MFEFEELYLSKGCKHIAGMDEAGRGPLAGPVVCACVIMPLDKKDIIDGVNDSKKLTVKKREELYSKIIDKAISFHIAVIDNKIIDEINILNATKLGMKECVEELSITPDIVLVDAVKGLDVKVQTDAIIKGDAKSYSIGAASILAKVYRDKLMEELDKKYPNYNFKKHKGYGTKEHIMLLQKFGKCEIHRDTFIKHFVWGKMQSYILGKRGETLVKNYLQENKYNVIETNFRTKLGEIDLIAIKNDIVVFIEVKTRTSNCFGLPREAVNLAKQRKIKLVASEFLQRKKWFDKEIEFDVIEVLNGEINHIKYAF